VRSQGHGAVNQKCYPGWAVSAGRVAQPRKEVVMAAMFYTLKEAVQRLNTTEDELRAMVEQGKLREFRDGLARLFRVDEVEAMAPEASETAAEEAALPQSTEHTLSDPDAGDIEGAPQAAIPDAGEVGFGTPEPEEAGLDMPAFDIRMELGMLDAAESGAPEHPIPSEAAAAVTSTEGSVPEEQLIEDEPPGKSQPAPPVFRPAPMPYARLSAPKRSAWQWFVGGLRADRPAAVIVLFVVLGIVLSACAAVVYFLHKSL